MSLATDKSGVLNNIAATTSIGKHGNIPPQTNSFTSTNNSNDTIPFLLDTLSVVAGSAGLQSLIGELFVNFTNSAEPKMKTSLKNQFNQYNSSSSLPSYFAPTGSGLSVPVKNIDTKSKLQQPKTSLLYDNSKPNFDSTAYDCISNNGTNISYNNMTMNYDSNLDSINVKSTTSSSIGDWFGDFIDNTEILNKKELMTNVMNSIYGTIDAESNKTVEQIYEEQQIGQLLDNLGNDDDSLELSQEELDGLMKKAYDLKNGVVSYNLGCGIFDVSMTTNDLTNLISQTSGSTDPNSVGNAIANTFNGSNDLSNDSTSTENQESMKDGFFKKIINAIKRVLTEALTTSPQIRILLAIFSAFKNNGVVELSNPIDDFKKFKSLIKCLIDEIKKMLNEFIFNLIITFLIALLSPVVKIIIKEKINNYLTVLRGLI